MATRYWVGGTGNWNSTSKWSTTSGGGSGASVPTSSDNVIIDSSSGFDSGGTITLDVEASMLDFTSTAGHTYTIDGETNEHYFGIYGSATFESGIVFDYASCPIFLSTSTGKTITTNSCDLVIAIFDGAGGGWSLQDNLIVSSSIQFGNGIFDANDLWYWSDVFSSGRGWSSRYYKR
jgi:hypothetical protein